MNCLYAIVTVYTNTVQELQRIKEEYNSGKMLTGEVCHSPDTHTSANSH